MFGAERAQEVPGVHGLPERQRARARIARRHQALRGLHPLAVIFALLAFGQLFGFAGVLLALPASASLLVGLRVLKAKYVASPLYRRD